MKKTREFLAFGRGIARTIRSILKIAWQDSASITTLISCLTVIISVIPIIAAWLTKLVFDALSQNLLPGPKIGLSTLAIILLAQFLLTTVREVIQPAYIFLNQELARRLRLAVDTKMYTKIASFLGIRQFEDPKFYDKIRLAQQGGIFATGQVVDVLSQFVQSSVTLLGFAGLLFFVNPVLGALLALSVLPTLVTELQLVKQRVSLMRTLSADERRAFYFTFLMTNDYAAKELRLYDLGRFFLDQFTHYSKLINQLQHLQSLREFRWQILPGIFSSILVGGTTAWVVLQAFAERFELGDVALYTAAILGAQGALVGIIRSLSLMTESIASFKYFEEIDQIPQLLHIAPKSLRQGIELKNVSFGYPDQPHPVLQNLNLFIPAGKILALVGLNGAGKTTLIKLLTRLYDPNEGEILWDGINIKEFDVLEYRKNLGVIFQDYLRYDLTAYQNISLGNTSAMGQKDYVIRAAKKVGIHEFLSGLESGYDTLISRAFFDEDANVGVDLSGGQWQKIALARMFMRDATLFLLDEPAASLDAQAEHETFNDFGNLTDGRTTLFISHRFSTVRRADIVAVLEAGQICQYGTHEDLMALDGVYRTLFNLQASQFGAIDTERTKPSN
jgi:ATP-binding cassette, subfamily B, bacterial